MFLQCMFDSFFAFRMYLLAAFFMFKNYSKKLEEVQESYWVISNIIVYTLVRCIPFEKSFLQFNPFLILKQPRLGILFVLELKISNYLTSHITFIHLHHKHYALFTEDGCVSSGLLCLTYYMSSLNSLICITHIRRKIIYFRVFVCGS